MELPKNLAVLLGRVNELHIVIVALSFSLVFGIALFIILRGLLSRLGVNKIYKISIPIFIMVSLVLLTGISALTSQSFVCQSCHKVQAKEMRLSIHSKVSCASCHRTSNVTAIPIQKLNQTRMLVNSLTGNYKLPLKTTIDNGVCLDCHRGLERGIKVRFKVMMSHREVIEADILCTECHDSIAHEKKVKVDQVSIMEKCSGCHNDTEASSRCQTCHMSSVWLGMEPADSWGITHGKNWIKVHGSRSLYICKNCHYEKDCNECHMTVPHPEGWAYIHGQEARNNRSECTTCHKHESFCRECHRIPMPHHNGWLSTHKWEIEAAGEEVCYNCHFKKDCQECHKRHTHKNFNKKD